MSSADPVPPVAQPRRLRLLRAAAWTLGTIAVPAGLAAAFLPGYLKGVAIDQIREQLHREARIESISVNPFLLSATVRGLTIAQADGKSELFGFDEMHTRVGLGSLFRRAPVIEELNIDRPRVHLARLAPERYNISDIIESILARPSSPEWPRFELNSLSIDNATVTFDDRPTGKLHKFEQARILLPALSSFADDRSEFAEPALTAIVNGEPLADRPALKLDIAGRVDPVADRDALHRRALLRKIAAQRQDEQVAQGEASVSTETITIPPADYPRLLKRAYDNEKFAKPKNAAGIATELPAAEMEKLMLANIVVSPDALRELGERRAGTAKEALVKAGAAGERMFIVAAAAEAAAETPDAKRGPRVDFILK